ncbi:MAG: hypothetical protein QXU85_07420, partial [Sulfolobales archaeon]
RARNCFSVLGLKVFVVFRDNEERYFKPLKGRARCELRAVRLEQYSRHLRRVVGSLSELQGRRHD